jgi:hypothetical protein
MRPSSIYFAVLVFSLSIIVASLSACVQSQGGSRTGVGGGKGGGGRGGGGSQAVMATYDKGTFTTITGTVTDASVGYNRHMGEDGLHLMVETASDTYKIHVCPAWYSDQQGILFDDGESVTVSGSEFSKDGPNIFAATITRRAAPPLNLRDADTGDTLWKGRKRTQ